MARHDDDYNVLVTVISHEHKSSLGPTNPFLEDTVTWKRDGATTSSSLDDAHDLGC